MTRVVIAGSSQRRRVASGGGGGGITFDAVGAPFTVLEGTSIQTPSWTIGSGSNSYLLAFAVSAAFEVVAAPGPVSHSGSGGTALTGLMSEFIPASHTGFESAGRAFGLATPPTGAGNTYAVGSQLWKGIASASYFGVSGVGDIQTFDIAHEPATSGTPYVANVTLSTPNTSDVCVAFAWARASTTGMVMSAGSGMIDRGGDNDDTDTFGIHMVEAARTGSTTTLSVSMVGSTFYYVGMIGVVLQAA